MGTTVHPVPRSPGKWRYRTLDEKRRIVEETLASEASVAIMARRHGVNANQLFQWRKLYQAGLLGTSYSEAEVGGVRLLPVTVANQPEQRAQEATPAESSTGAIHIEFQGLALVRSLSSSMKRGERCLTHLWIGAVCGLLIMLACILRFASASQEFC
jgi:transposase